MKAIVGIESWSSMQERALEEALRLDAEEVVPETDYHLNFANTEQLFGELTPARLRLLDTLKALGPASIYIYALAKKLERNYSNVHSDVSRLIELDLIEKDAGNRILVPWESIQIHVSLDGSHADSASHSPKSTSS